MLAARRPRALSLDCSLVDGTIVGMTVTREELFEEIWAEPMTTVARRHGVSSNYLARVCFRMGLPRPCRGFWAKLAAGRTVNRPVLRPPNPEDETEWTRGGYTNCYERPRRQNLVLPTRARTTAVRRGARRRRFTT